MDLGLSGKRAIVLASSSGLGRATAQELAREGATVVINSRNAENLRNAKVAILEETDARDNQVHRMVCDITNTRELQTAINDAIDRLGGVDILITNSGGPATKKLSFAEAELQDFDDLYNSTVKCRIVAVYETLEYLQHSSGSIVNIVAASAQEPPENQIVRNTLRPAIYGFSKSLAKEYATDGLRVNCLCPRKVVSASSLGDVNTSTKIEDKYKGMSHAEIIESRIKDEIPLGRPGDPSEFGKIAAFLASDSANHITGQNLAVDGGWSSHGF